MGSVHGWLPRGKSERAEAMTFSQRAVEAAAMAAAQVRGDDFDNIPKDKSEWTEQRGHFGGRFRDVNEPFQPEYVEMAEACLTAALAVDGMALQGWQPISSAPRDGTWVVLYDAEQYRPVHVRNWRAAETNGKPVSGWWDEYSQYRPSFRPTHWQPLPQPPAASEGEERK